MPEPKASGTDVSAFQCRNAPAKAGNHRNNEEHLHMKWKNFDIGNSCYYITSTFTEWMPLFTDKQILKIVCEEITAATKECDGAIAAYVFMPDHLHLLVYLPEEGLLHRYCKLWRGRSARRITKYLTNLATQDVSAFQCRNAHKNPQTTLARMATHANGTAQYTVWKERPRALAIWSSPMLHQKANYIHNNPIRKNLVQKPEEWPYSSWRFYEGDGKSLLPISTWPA